MSKEMAFTTIDPSADKLRKYDEICGAAFVNLFTLFKESEKIILYPFDAKNEEHLFLLGVAKGVAGSLGKTVVIDASRYQLWKINRKADKECYVLRVTEQDKTNGIRPDTVLNFMWDWAKSLCGEDFTFADIYKEFYCRKKVKK